MATAQLIVNIAADISEIVTGVNAVKNHLESLGMKVKQQNVLMKETAKATQGMFDEMTKGWVGFAAKLNTLDYTMRIVKNAFMSTFGEGFKAVDDFRLGTAAAAAVVAQFMEMKPGETLAEGFQRATQYAEDMYPVLEKIAAQTLLSGRHTQMMFQEFAKGGVLLDAANAKQVAGFKAMGNAIAIMTKGQDLERQIMTEIKAVMEGENRAGAVMIRLLEAQNPKIKEQLKLWREQGTVLEHMGELLQGFDLASGKLELTLDAVVTRLQTSMQQIARGAFSSSFDHFLKTLIEIDDWLQQMKDVISKDIYNALQALETTLGSIKRLTEEIFNATDDGKSSVRSFAESWMYVGNVILPGVLEFIGNIIGAIKETGSSLKEMTQGIFYDMTLQLDKANEAYAKAEEHAKKARGFAFPSTDTTKYGFTDKGKLMEEGIFERLNRQYEEKMAMFGWGDILGGSGKPPKTKKIADDIAKDAQKIKDAYDSMLTSLQKQIDTKGLEDWQKSLVELKYDIEELQKKGFSNEQIANIVHLKIQLIGMDKAIADMKAMEQMIQFNKKAVENFNKEWASIAEATANYSETLVKMQVSLGMITEAEGLEKRIELLQKEIDARYENLKVIMATEGVMSTEYQKGATDIANMVIQLQNLRKELQTLNDSGNFALGLSEGAKEYIKSLEFGFERGKDMAKEAAEAMNNFFEDAFTGKIKLSWKTLLEWMGGLFAKFLADLATMAIAKPIIVPIMQQVGGYAQNITQGALGAASNYFGGGNYASAAGGVLGYGASAASGLSGYSLTGPATLPGMGYSLTGSASGGVYGAGSYGLMGGGMGAGAALAKLGMIAAVAYTFGDILSSLVTGSYKTKTKSFPTMQMGYEGGEWGAYGGLGKYGKGIESFFGGDALKNLEDKSGLREFEQKFAKAFTGFSDILKNFATEFGMSTDKFEEDWKAAKKTIKTEADAIAYINKTMGDYAQFVLNMDFSEWQKDGEEMIDTISRILGSLTGMKTLVENIDLVIQYLDNTTDSFAQFRIGINDLEKQIQDTKTKMATLTDPSEVFDAANELYSLTMQRYEAEIQFVLELQQAIQDLQLEFAQFTSSMIKKIAELGGDTGGFDDAIKMIADAGKGLAQQLMNPDISLGEKLPMLKNFLSFLDEWYQLNLDKIQVVGEAEIAIYEDRIESLTKEKDLINDQINALQTQLKLVEDWQDVLDKTKDMIFDLKATTASPRDVFERLNYVKGEIERVQGQFRGSSGESQIGFARELQTLISSYGQIGQEAFQRPSMEYQAVYNDMLTWLQEIEAVASVGAKSTEDLLGEIEKLQGRSNQIEIEIADWQEKIHGIEERMATDIKTLNQEAKKYYQWAQDTGNSVYSGQITAMQTALQAVIGNGTVEDHIKFLRNELVGPNGLQGVKDYLNAILLDMTGYNALAVPSYQHGTSYVPQTGLAYLHKGETVIPANGGINLTLAPTIYAGGDANPREIWRELEDYAIQSVKGGRLGKALKER